MIDDQVRDGALIARILGGDREAADVLVRRHSPALRRLMLQAGARTQDVDDVLQETWIRVVRSAHRYDPLQSFPRWLFAIAINRLRSHRERHGGGQRTYIAGHQPAEDAAERIPERSGSAEEALEEAESADAIRARVARLPPHLADAILLRYFEELSEKQMAARMNIPVGTVKSRLHTAIRKLRSDMERTPNE